MRKCRLTLVQPLQVWRRQSMCGWTPRSTSAGFACVPRRRTTNFLGHSLGIKGCQDDLDLELASPKRRPDNIRRTRNAPAGKCDGRCQRTLPNSHAASVYQRSAVCMGGYGIRRSVIT